MEDLDKPREVAGASSDILNILETFGFKWDSNVLYQSQREEAYLTILQQLKAKDLTYPCTCSRKEVLDSISHLSAKHAIYPKTCLTSPIKPNKPSAWRIKTIDETIRFNDAIQGDFSQNLSQDTGDFIIKRADGLFAYQLAVVVDDAMQGITHVVRGADLLESTVRQIYIQRVLNFPTPRYAHIPIATNKAGEKLSKQTLATSLDKHQPVAQLWLALEHLNQKPPMTLKTENLNTFWKWAIAHWSSVKIQKKRTIII
jgi:glutamyl-Q tRNA(Asp) synthetase